MLYWYILLLCIVTLTVGQCDCGWATESACATDDGSTCNAECCAPFRGGGDTGACGATTCDCGWASESACATDDGSTCNTECCCPYRGGGGDSGGGDVDTSWKTGKTTRYWDCCKPSCTWSSNVGSIATGFDTVRSCLKSGATAGKDAINVCGGGGSGGPSYSCVDNQPFTKDGMMYGFVAKDGKACCQCMELEFTSGTVSGETMIVQVTNTGGDLSEAHFDIQIPGAGFGVFNGCAATSSEPSNGDAQFSELYDVWGARYGGVSSASSCDALPSSLRPGCKWRFNDFKNADNPNVRFRRVRCPKVLTDISGCKLADDDNYPPLSSGNEEGSANVDSTTKTTSTYTVDTTTQDNTNTGTATQNEGTTNADDSTTNPTATNSLATQGNNQNTVQDNPNDIGNINRLVLASILLAIVILV